MYENLEIMDRMVEFDIPVDYSTMEDIIDPDVPKADLDYVDDMPF